MEEHKEINVGLWVDDRLAALAPSENWQPDMAAGLARLHRRRDRRNAWNRGWAWTPAMAVVVMVLCALAFPVTRVSAQRCVNACVALWSSWSGSNGFPRVGIGIAERKLAPDFTLPDMAGKPVQLSEFRGQVVLLNFWATWCGPCKVEIPWFVEFERAYGGAGLAVLGVSMDQDGWKSVKPYIEAEKVNYRVMVDDDQIARMYGGLEALPATLLIDKAGRIAGTHIGLVDKKTYEEELKALIAEKTPLPAGGNARAADAPGVRATIQPLTQRRPAPAFSLTDAAGKRAKLSEYRGKVVLLDFWATWCHGCKEEIPWFSEFQRKYGAQGLAVVGVSLDDGGWGVVKPFVAKAGAPYRMLLGDAATAKKYSIESMPDTFIIDRSGRIAAAYFGLADRGDVEANIRSVLEKR